MTKVGFVSPWFGVDLEGEAEHHVYHVATRLAERGHEVEVLTTCGRSRQGEWRNELAPGASENCGVVVRRFPIATGDRAAFDRLTRALRERDARPKPPGVTPVPEPMARSFLGENLHSPGLSDHLARTQADYGAIVFIDYRFGPALSGILRVPGRAVLRPFLRDETVAYLPDVEKVFDSSRRILFGSDGEAFLAAKLYGPAMLRKGAVIGDAEPSRGARDEQAWEAIADRYEEVLELRRQRQARPARHPRLHAIHQLLPSIDYGDAISNQVVFTMEVLRELGYDSQIFVLDIAEPMQDLAKRFTPHALRPDDGLLYHHAIGTSLTPHAVAHPGPKALVYHNITPAHFFESWDPKFARILDLGRKDLQGMASAFPISAGDSRYNAEELRETGFSDPSVVPIFVEPMRWSQPADPEWMKLLQDGRTNILFVGRVAPNKCQHHLLEAFRAYLAFDPQARLILAGVWPDGHPYVRHLRSESERLGIADHVLLTWRVTDAQLLACYRTAHLFWSMSEHEGFGVPLVEAMWFDVPVLAYRSSAIPETLGDAGIMFTEKGRWPELAALAHMLVEDRELRRKVIEAQRKRRTAFLPEAILPSLLGLLEKLGVDEAGEAGQAPSPEMSSEYPSMMRGQR